MENISEEGILNLQEERELAEGYNGFTYFRENDVIVAKITPCFENGKVAICKGLTNGLGFGTTELHVLRAKNIVYAEYIYLVIQSHIFRNMGTALMKGAAGQKRVPTEFIQNFTIGIPPMNEQKDIINYVKQKSDYLFALINSTKIEIDKLKEYRQSLITAAVTGKIDVRNYNIEKNQMKEKNKRKCHECQLTIQKRHLKTL